jgi:hypothetical protein
MPRTAAAAGLLLALALTSPALTGCAGQPTAVPGAANPGVTVSPAIVSPSTAPVAASRTASQQPEPSRTPQAPREYRTETVLGANTTDRPVGWTRTSDQARNRTDYRDATGQLLLRFEAYGTTSATPDQVLRDQAATAADTYPGYHLIRLSGPAEVPGTAMVNSYAEWEFTFEKDAVTRQVVIRAVGGTSTPGGQPVARYSIYYSAPLEYFAATSQVYRKAVEHYVYDL